MNAESLEEGFGFDGSSIRGFQQIQESDMVLVPDPDTAVADPFRDAPTLILYCFVKDPLTRQPYDKDPRYVAKKAEAYLPARGIADISYFGPEAEFYIFDSARFDQNQHSGYYYVDSVEGAWNTGADEPGGNLGYKPGYKEGYFPVPPTDHFTDLRSRDGRPPAGGGSRRSRCTTTRWAPPASPRSTSATARLLRTADKVTLFKYIVKNTAWRRGKTVTFMPKPIFQDNGSGMHVHQSLWTGSKPLFYDEKGYAGLSDMARYYIGGLLKHAPALLAFAAPTTNSYRRLVPGLRGAGQPGLQPAEPLGGGAHPGVLAEARRPSGSSSAAPTRRPTRTWPSPPCCWPAWTGSTTGVDPGAPVDKDLYDLPPEELAKVPSVPGRWRSPSTPWRRTTTSCWPAVCSPRS